MKSRGFSQLANGIVAALLLSACAQTGQDRPQKAAPVAPPVVETVQPPQPILPVLKPGTKTRAPAKPTIDPVEAVPGPAPDAAAAVDPAEGAPGSAIPGAPSPGSADTGAADPGATQSPPDEVGVLLGTVPPNPDVVAAPPEPESLDTGSPDDLRGQTEIQVINVLGSPLSTRAEGTSTIWSYRSDACTLDIYFFLDVADNQRRALSYELVAKQAGAQAGKRCYRTLKAAAAAN